MHEDMAKLWNEKSRIDQNKKNWLDVVCIQETRLSFVIMATGIFLISRSLDTRQKARSHIADVFRPGLPAKTIIATFEMTEMVMWNRVKNGRDANDHISSFPHARLAVSQQHKLLEKSYNKRCKEIPACAKNFRSETTIKMSNITFLRQHQSVSKTFQRY